ncbi:hypothetical protein C8F04DRAFT_1351905 [Mycena alexandri]|uniref:Uncharacterized protein n=1 Tax=Mycena alexandri TaxID=1745969 RepID=A0AAD6RVL2_9AGAR|nr:hypothetical protein C8F04DRAFT_1351905 [Mycena alexandri]
MAWVTIVILPFIQFLLLTSIALSTGFPRRSSTQPIRPETDIRSTRKSTKFSSAAFELPSQMSTPRLEPIKSPAQGRLSPNEFQLNLRRTNASLAAASLDKAKIKSSLIWIAFFAPSNHDQQGRFNSGGGRGGGGIYYTRQVHNMNGEFTEDIHVADGPGTRRCGVWICGSVRRGQTPKCVCAHRHSARAIPAGPRAGVLHRRRRRGFRSEIPAPRRVRVWAEGVRRCEGGGTRDGAWWVGGEEEGYGGWEEKRCGVVRVGREESEGAMRYGDAEQRSGGTSPRPRIPVREQDLRCGARDSTRMRSCVPAECEFAQTAIGADSARNGCGVYVYGRGTTRYGVGWVRVGTLRGWVDGIACSAARGLSAHTSASARSTGRRNLVPSALDSTARACGGAREGGAREGGDDERKEGEGTG